MSGRTIPSAEWKWFGDAGHLIVGHDCRFHLCTLIGDYLVSTVGKYLPDEGVREMEAEWKGVRLEGKGDARRAQYMREIGYSEIGASRTYETMVFRAGKPCDAPECGCGLPAIDGQELDFDGYNDAGSATRGHMAMCQKWADPREEEDETPEPVRHEDGITHQSHRWVSVEVSSGPLAYGRNYVGRCDACGADIEAEEALEPCSETPEVAGGEREALRTGMAALREAASRPDSDDDGTGAVQIYPEEERALLALLSARPAPEREEVLDPQGVREAAIALMQLDGGPGVPDFRRAMVAVSAYLRVSRPVPVSEPERAPGATEDGKGTVARKGDEGEAHPSGRAPGAEPVERCGKSISGSSWKCMRPKGHEQHSVLIEPASPPSERAGEREEALREALRWALDELEDGCGCGDDDCDWCAPYERALRALAASPAPNGGETR